MKKVLIIDVKQAVSEIFKRLDVTKKTNCSFTFEDKVTRLSIIWRPGFNALHVYVKGPGALSLLGQEVILSWLPRALAKRTTNFVQSVKKEQPLPDQVQVFFGELNPMEVYRLAFKEGE